MDLKSAREEIYNIDMEIIALIRKRQECAEYIHRAKKEENLSVRDEEQRMAVLKRAYDAAEKKGLDPEMTKEIFGILIEMNENAQKALEI